MAEFFGNTDGEERKVEIVSAKLKQKSIRMEISMPLTGQKVTGMPLWLSQDYEFVEKTHGIVSKDDMRLEVYDINLSDDNLFTKESTARKATLKSFQVYEEDAGPASIVYLYFVVDAPFNSKLWSWLGQYTNEDQYMRFTKVEVPVQEVSKDEKQQELLPGQPKEKKPKKQPTIQ